jgi:hypothetical protein
MVEYSIKTAEGLAAFIDNLLNEHAIDIYLDNRERNRPKVKAAIQKRFGEDQPTVTFRSGDSDLDDLFYHIINPKNITGKLNRGGRKYGANFIWSDICRNGLGPHQYDRVAKTAREIVLEELEKEDGTGEKALAYLESKATDPTQRWRARVNWVEFLASYAQRERIVRDPAYVRFEEEISGEKIDIDAVKKSLPSFVAFEKISLIARKLMQDEDSNIKEKAAEILGGEI